MPRPRTPLISRRLAVETALALIDAEGYEGFSLEKLARTLNVKSPSLYHHFANKNDLLTEAAFALLSDIPLDEPDPERWQDWFIQLCVESHRRVMAHPRAAGLLFAHFPDDLTTASHDRGMQILADQGFPADLRWGVMRGLEKLLFGLAFADAADAVAARDPMPADRERWPHLVAGLEANLLDPEQIVVHAVKAYLDGALSRYAVAPVGRRAG